MRRQNSEFKLAAILRLQYPIIQCKRNYGLQAIPVNTQTEQTGKQTGKYIAWFSPASSAR